MKRVRFCDRVQVYQPVGTRTLLRLDTIVEQYEIDCEQAKNPQDLQKAKVRVIEAIDRLPGKKTVPEGLVKQLMTHMENEGSGAEILLSGFFPETRLPCSPRFGKKPLNKI